jgi:hypothetical protein
MTPFVMVISWNWTLDAKLLDPPVRRSAVLPEFMIRKYPAVESAPFGVARTHGWSTSMVPVLKLWANAWVAQSIIRMAKTKDMHFIDFFLRG